MIPALALRYWKPLAGAAIILLFWAAWLWSDHRGFVRGVRVTDARWAEASARMQAATIRATNAADTIARQREAENAATIGELRHEAAKADDSPVGPGVRAVIERMQRDARR